MTAPSASFIRDEAEPCGRCGGKGWISIKSGQPSWPTTTHQQCWICGGSGRQSIRLEDKA